MIQVLAVGMLQEHTYFFIDDETKHGFIVDPGDEAKRLLAHIQKEGYVIEKILLTHGHFDHIGAASELRDALNVPIVIHEQGEKYLKDPNWNLSGSWSEPMIIEADEYVKDGDIITLSTNPKMSLKVLHGPGHTLDGVAYYSAEYGVAFVGDIIFAGSVGRSDFVGGNSVQLLDSIRNKIFTLPDETVLCPGHGETTTVGKEKVTNPYFNMYE